MTVACGRVVVRNYGIKLRCTHARGHCPIHDRRYTPLTDKQHAELRAWVPWAERASIDAAGIGDPAHHEAPEPKPKPDQGTFL